MKNWYKYIKISNTNTEEDRRINLTSNEENIFNIIRSARSKYESDVSLRVAGGWVRDRLLGKMSDDIDIAVSGGNGIAIAEAVRKFDLDMTGGKRTDDPYSVSLEKSNIDLKAKSAGLQVGGINILGVKIEFVPMRTEVYSEESRIPLIRATDNPSEDAKRRDLTINSLYYNLDTKKVEDYTGGFDDLKSKILKTPISPIETLTEDPLRALRVIRFVSKMPGFKLDDSLLSALSMKEVHDAYRKKVSPERAKTEIEKIIKGERPSDSLRLLLQSGLYLPVFSSERLDSFKPITMDQNTRHHKLNLLNHTILVIENLDRIMRENGFSDRERYLAVLAALFHDFGKMDPSIEKPSKKDPSQSSYHGHENVSAELAEEILKRLGFGVDRNIVKSIVESHMIPHSFIDLNNKSMGNFIRRFESLPIDDEIKESLWKLVFVHSIADTMGKGKIDEKELEEIEQKKKSISKIEEFLKQREKVGKKPILNGNQIMKLFPAKDPKSGYIANMQKSLLEAQDDGTVTNEEQAKEYLIKLFN